MAEAIEFSETEEKNAVIDNMRKIYLVSLGAASYTVSNTTDYAKNARTNLNDLTTKLIEQGEEADKKTRETVNKQTENRQKELRNTQKRVEKKVSKRMESILHALNIPTQKDINNLSNKVARLNKKVDEMAKAE